MRSFQLSSVFCIFIFLTILLCGCSSEKETSTTSGTIVEISPQTILVRCSDDCLYYLGYSMSSKVFINGERAYIEDLNVGDNIIISYYSGPILESSPAFLDGVFKIELFE